MADAVSVEDNVSRSQSPLKHTASLPPFSPPTAPPCSSPDINVGTDCVQDAGYASLPDSQDSKRITKVRSIKQKANQMHACKPYNVLVAWSGVDVCYMYMQVFMSGYLTFS